MCWCCFTANQLIQQNRCPDAILDCYLFVNATRKRAKVLRWDGTGQCIDAKRLERGRFASLGRDSARRGVALTISELPLFLDRSTLVGRIALSPPSSTASSSRPSWPAWSPRRIGSRRGGLTNPGTVTLPHALL